MLNREGRTTRCYAAPPTSCIDTADGDLRAVMDAVYDDLRVLRGPTHFDLRMTIAAEAVGHVINQGQAIRRIVRGLLASAIDFVDADWARAHVRLLTLEGIERLSILEIDVSSAQRNAFDLLKGRPDEIARCQEIARDIGGGVLLRPTISGVRFHLVLPPQRAEGSNGARAAA